MMTVSQVLHRFSFGLYRNFSNSPASQKILKVALPLLAFGLGVAVAWFLTRKVSIVPKPLLALQNPEELARKKRELLKAPVPRELYNGVRNGEDELLPMQAHRWSLPTNLQTLVRFSAYGTAYPANHIVLDGSPVSYIMAESPLNNETVAWQKDYYGMAIGKNAGLLLSVACPFVVGGDVHQLETGQYHFVTYEKPMQLGALTVECLNINPIQISDLYYANELKISLPSGEKKTLWQLLPKEAPGGSFKEIQAVVDTVNGFIKDKKLTVDRDHPLLVNCRTAIDRTGRFVVFHDLQAKVEALIKTQLVHPHLTDQAICDNILGHQDISQMLIQRALVIEYSSTQTAAIDALRDTVLPNFGGEPNCTPATVNQIYREHVLTTIARLRHSVV